MTTTSKRKYIALVPMENSPQYIFGKCVHEDPFPILYKYCPFSHVHVEERSE